MKQVVQAASGGPVRVVDVPVPVIGPTEVLVATVATIVSAGAERAVTDLALAGLVAKARARPDLVRKVATKARTDGLRQAVRTVRDRLGSDVPLGYSGCGWVVEVGTAVAGIRAGDLVATGGAGRANHAEYQAVPGLLCARVPDGVEAGAAAFATIASIALHGLRLAEVGPGSRLVVVGLGLVGQLAARLALASGCEVAGVDLAELPLATARAAGVVAHAEAGETTTAAVRDWSRGRGADAVLVCAAGHSAEPVMRSTALARDRAQLVVIGDVGLDLARTPFYDKELTVRFARSYGPGRYERGYEDWGVDYPAGQVRWTEGRNQEAVLDLLCAGRLRVDDLVTHTFPVDEAPKAYELVAARAEPHLAIRFDYPSHPGADTAAGADTASGAGVDDVRPGAQGTGDRPAETHTRGQRAQRSAGDGPAGRLRPRLRVPRQRGAAAARRGSRVGWIGAGAFSGAVLLPAFRAAGFDQFVTVASAGGRSARAFADRYGFAGATAGADAVLDDDDIDVVVIATPHATHAELAVRALERGRHVWCEKPLALTVDELDRVERAVATGGGALVVGYNRRFSPGLGAARAAFEHRSGPLSVVYRVAAGPVPAGHWYHDRRQGGRLLGEVCHFVDACSALVASPVDAVAAVAGRGGELLLAADLAVTLRHVDGSLSTIAYSCAQPRTAREEKVEALAGGRQVHLDDYRELIVDGRSVWRGAQNKGHREAAAAFLRMCRGGDTGITVDLLASSRATLAAADALGVESVRPIPRTVGAVDAVDAVPEDTARIDTARGDTVRGEDGFDGLGPGGAEAVPEASSAQV
ncbi:bi-domain-containing oxidoreductase [Frankia sp. AiPa1]|uniref:bi-domain-containing oxidoreductase n=1 Tax=Frankia sp. AiPa1 TaxID=573492 RepID=UPI00202B4A8C|nr:bi-domain-containing oxidoreductase [Frankia sp. AiPa1]MCL9759239.1 bi-domain-containing oxidoreductase [Frankia sp. AiPa1]